MLVAVIVDYRGEQKTSFETHLFPFWERTKTVLRDTNDFNIDSLMETKKISAVFRTARVFHNRELSSTRRWAINSDGAARPVEISSAVIKVVLLAMCSLAFALLLSCWVHFKVRSLSFWWWFCVIWHLQPGTALNLRFKCFPQTGFRLHSSFAEIFRRTEVVFIAMLHTVMVQKALFGNSPVRWPFKYDATHTHFEQIQLE